MRKEGGEEAEKEDKSGLVTIRVLFVLEAILSLSTILFRLLEPTLLGFRITTILGSFLALASAIVLFFLFGHKIRDKRSLFPLTFLFCFVADLFCSTLNNIFQNLGDNQLAYIMACIGFAFFILAQLSIGAYLGYRLRWVLLRLALPIIGIIGLLLLKKLDWMYGILSVYASQLLLNAILASIRLKMCKTPSNLWLCVTMWVFLFSDLMIAVRTFSSSVVWLRPTTDILVWVSYLAMLSLLALTYYLAEKENED